MIVSLVFRNEGNQQIESCTINSCEQFPVFINPGSSVSMLIESPACIFSGFEVRDERGVPCIIHPVNGYRVGRNILFPQGAPELHVLCPINSSGKCNASFYTLPVSENNPICTYILQDAQETEMRLQTIRQTMDAQMRRFHIMAGQMAESNLRAQQDRWIRMVEGLQQRRSFLKPLGRKLIDRFRRIFNK